MRSLLGGIAGYLVNSTLMYVFSICIYTEDYLIIVLIILVPLMLWVLPMIATSIALLIAGEETSWLTLNITWAILNVITITAWVVIIIFKAVILGIYIYVGLLTLQTLLLLINIYSETKHLD